MEKSACAFFFFLQKILKKLIILKHDMNQPPVYQPPTTSNEVTYPTASAFLIDNDDNAASEQHKSNTLVSSNTGRNDYASAHIVDNPFSSELFTATPTQAFATALDPWSKETTTNVESNNAYRPPVISPEAMPSNVPSAMMEDPMLKKLRRRRRRRGRMFASGATAFVISSIFLGPIGGILVGAATAKVTKGINKRAERRKDKRVMHQYRQIQETRRRRC